MRSRRQEIRQQGETQKIKGRVLHRKHATLAVMVTTRYGHATGHLDDLLESNCYFEGYLQSKRTIHYAQLPINSPSNIIFSQSSCSSSRVMRNAFDANLRLYPTAISNRTLHST